MTGLEKILEHIASDAKANSEQLLSQAKTQAEELKAAAKAEEEETKKIIDEKKNAETELLLNRGKSAAQLANRKLMLEAKQKVITEVMEAAVASLRQLPDQEYFDTILKMIPKYAQDQEGEILFSKKDLGRLPASFASEVKKMKLIVSKETRETNGGFVLVYGEIEENCSFDALFFSAKEVLQDKVRDFLFS